MDPDEQDRIEKVKLKYRMEREKRIRPTGMNQYDEFNRSGSQGRSARTNRKEQLQKDARILIIGAGFGGLLFAVRLIDAGFCTARQITIVDDGKDFGGTWSSNKYPGLVCDIESYIYLPLLEETGYMSSGKYISGIKIQEHAVRVAKKWDLVQQTRFETSVSSLRFTDKLNWEATINTPDGPPFEIADFVFVATGFLNSPKVPNLKGLHVNRFGGNIIHSSRWNYEYTGGSQENPDMTKLKETRVGVVGTGATAVQIIPELAKWAKEVVVFQRTPASVWSRDNNCIHPESEFEKLGWQRKRMENFNAFITNETPLPKENLVNDAWTKMQSQSVLIGGPSNLEEGTWER
ncbi:hypothetical protein N7490_009105 [Penicillium lividum]|nr:hypothetical protein N7490_009105 [Penicillium lividum]